MGFAAMLTNEKSSSFCSLSAVVGQTEFNSPGSYRD